MANVFKLRKGLNINLKGKAEKKKVLVSNSKEYGLIPDFFSGVTPKLVVKEGDHVLAGDALFVNKACQQIGFASPVSGIVVLKQSFWKQAFLVISISCHMLYRQLPT